MDSRKFQTEEESLVDVSLTPLPPRQADSTESQLQPKPPTPAPAAPAEGNEFNLIVCGTDNAEDGWIFSDFMGYAKELEKRGCKADCLSCFPLLDYFDELRDTWGINDIKFGKFGDKKAPFCSFSREDYEANKKNGTSWFTQVKPKHLLSQVRAWMSSAQKKTEPGDIVNIKILAHGQTSTGDLRIGTELLATKELCARIETFREDVGVNIIVGSCYSGLVTEAFKASGQKNRYIAAATSTDKQSWSMARSTSGHIRCGRFANAIIHSMTGTTDSSTPPDPWTLQHHEDLIKEKMRNVSTGQPVVNPQFHFDQELNMPLEERFHRHVSLALMAPASPPTGTQVNWPKLSAAFQQGITQQATNLKKDDKALAASDDAVAVIKAEGSRCNTSWGYPPDIGVYNQLHREGRGHGIPAWNKLLVNLTWRAFRQTITWSLFSHLLRKGLVSLDCLQAPMDLFQVPHNAHTVFRLFLCFPFVTYLIDQPFTTNIPLQSAEYSNDLHWLAITLSRHGTDLCQLVDEIKASEILGEIDDVAYETFQQKVPDYQIPPNLRDGKPTADGLPSPFGVWLPHGLGKDRAKCREEIMAHIKRAADIVHSYNDMIGRTWAVIRVVLEGLEIDESTTMDFPIFPSPAMAQRPESDTDSDIDGDEKYEAL